jgi:hypothetical protein
LQGGASFDHAGKQLKSYQIAVSLHIFAVTNAKGKLGMNTVLRNSLFVLAGAAVLSLTTHVAIANTSAESGTSFKPQQGNQWTYLNRTSWGALSNSASFAVAVTGQVPLAFSSNWYLTGQFSSATSCQAYVNNGSQEAWAGAPVSGSGSTMTVQTISLGTAPGMNGAVLEIDCELEGGGYIGLAWR